MTADNKVRLNKLLAERGVAARRKCDALIEQGHVRVDGEVIREHGVRVDPTVQRITVRRRKLPEPATLVYFALHKPTGVLTTMSDPHGRPTVEKFLPTKGPRLFPVGRLDGDTSGLLLLTNDGGLAHRLMHPRYEVPKTYVLTLAKPPTATALKKLEQGFEFEPGEHSRGAEVHVLRSEQNMTELSLTICEGKFRQVRRMCEALGLDLRALCRVQVGPVQLGKLRPGKLRELSQREVKALRKSVQKPAAGRTAFLRKEAGR